jgi:hypothetical protein
VSDYIRLTDRLASRTRPKLSGPAQGEVDGAPRGCGVAPRYRDCAHPMRGVADGANGHRCGAAARRVIRSREWLSLT